MANITMFDTDVNGNFPGGAAAYAGYVDGHVGDQPNYGWVVKNFPKAHHLSISVFGNDADCLDIEPGAASPSSVAAWYRRQAARIARPCFYASADTMETDILPVIRASGFPREKIRLWSAHYGAGEHICGPKSCGLVSVDMDGTQWTSTAMGRSLDQSLLAASFFSGIPFPLVIGDIGPYVVTLQERLNAWHFGGLAADGVFGRLTEAAVVAAEGYFSLEPDGKVDKTLWDDLQKAPVQPAYGPPAGLRAEAGHTSVRLSWSAPAPVPGLPAPPEYRVFIYAGTHASLATLVPSYPRTSGPVRPEGYQFGSLEQGREYTAHVVSSGPGGKNVRPFAYASVTFTTG